MHQEATAAKAVLAPRSLTSVARLLGNGCRQWPRRQPAVLLPPRAGVVEPLSPPKHLTKALAVSLQQPMPPRTAAQQEDIWSLEDFDGELERDEFKEQGRRHLRELSTFTFKRWAFHRSTSRYARHMAGIFQSRIVRGLGQPLLSAGAAAAVVCTYEQAIQEGWLPDFLPTFLMPSLPFDITSFALSLLLVFRTNTSYDRWQQALGAWGGIGTRSLDTLRQLLASTARSAAGSRSNGARQAMLSAASTARWLVAFSRALKAQLTEDSNLEAELQELLTAKELSLLLAAHHRPSFALAVLTELAEAAPIRESQRVRVDENLTFFTDASGRCERILRTPIPLSYTRHTSRFMVIWLSCLPLGLWSECGWGTIPLTIVISFLLLGIEEIGVAIEEPFGILPLEQMCRELEYGLSDILEQATSSKKAAKEAARAAMQEAAAAAATTAADASVAGNGANGAANGGTYTANGANPAANGSGHSANGASAATSSVTTNGNSISKGNGARVEGMALGRAESTAGTSDDGADSDSDADAAPFLPAAFARSRALGGAIEPASASAIFVSYDESDP